MSWLVGVLDNKVKDEVRRIFRHRDALADSLCRIPQSERIDEQFVSRHRPQLEAAIRSLPRASRAVADLLILQAGSRDEIAKQLGIRPDTLRRRIARMMRALRARLDPLVGNSITAELTPRTSSRT
jgi:RNA polymerase sigma factor (sigma-70 family)